MVFTQIRWNLSKGTLFYGMLVRNILVIMYERILTTNPENREWTPTLSLILAQIRRRYGHRGNLQSEYNIIQAIWPMVIFLTKAM